MEDSFDELVELAEDDFGSEEGISGALVKKEVQLSSKYRNALLLIVKQL